MASGMENTSAASGSSFVATGGRDLDDDIPEAEEANYREMEVSGVDRTVSTDAGMGQEDLDEALTDLDDISGQNSPQFSPRSPNYSDDQEYGENGENSVDMDVSS